MFLKNDQHAHVQRSREEANKKEGVGIHIDLWKNVKNFRGRK